MSVEKKHLLLVGASRGVGCTTSNYLRSSGHVIYTAQRHPPISSLETDLDSEKEGFFKHCDFNQPAHAIDLVKDFTEEDIKLDGVLFCVSKAEVKPKYIWNAFDYREHLLVNVIGPVQLLTYLEHYEILKFGSPAVFTVNTGRVGSEYLPYGASQHALRPYVDFIHKTYPLTSDLLFVDRPEDGSDAQLDAFTEAILKVFTQGYSGMGKVINYR